MTTDRAQEIRAELNEIAPFPAWGTPVTALSVAKYLDVRAQILWSQHIVPFTGAQGESLDPQAVMHMNASFAAAHALRFFHQFLPQEADEVASQIAEAWNDGGGTGEWLYEHLGDDAEKIAGLAEELARVTAPAKAAS